MCWYSFFCECLDHGDAGEGFLRIVGQRREGLLALFPFLIDPEAHDQGDDEHEAHRDQTETGHLQIHTEHFIERKTAENHGITQGQNTAPEALADGGEVVREERHQIADLVDVVVLL